MKMILFILLMLVLVSPVIAEEVHVTVITNQQTTVIIHQQQQQQQGYYFAYEEDTLRISQHKTKVAIKRTACIINPIEWTLQTTNRSYNCWDEAEK